MSVTHPKGFVAAGVAAGLKTSGNKDVALVVNTGPRDTAAAVFTSNRIKLPRSRGVNKQSPTDKYAPLSSTQGRERMHRP